jgi:glycine/D-amino acid oxidase-like deaminating enzyme
MSQTYDVAVIGGGMIGVSVAYHCALRGLRTVLLEKRHLAGGGSGGNFGLVFWSGAQPNVPFTLERERDGAARVARLSDELDFDIEYRPAHGHCLICTEEDLALFSWHRDVFVAQGFSERIITVQELREAEPNMHVGPEVIAVLQTDEAVLNPLRLVHGFWRRAHDHGAELRVASPVIGFRRRGQRITHVVTPQEEIAAGEVVIAAGSWSREVGLMLGLSLPEYYIQGEAVVTEAVAPLLNGFVYWSTERIPAETRIANEAMTEGWESRANDCLFAAYDFGTVQTRRGNMLLGQMTHIIPSLTWPATWQVIPDSAREAMRLFPQLGKARILRSWRSPAPFTPDHLALLGRVGSFDNLLIASGFQSAITQCHWAGEHTANLITGAPVSEEAAVFDPLRFSQSVAS